MLCLPFAADADGPIPLFDKGTATYYVAVDVQGAGTLDFLVDTGSTYSTIDETTLAALEKRGLASFRRRVGGRLADGSRHYVPIYSIAAVDIGGHCPLADVEVAVLPGRSRAILGVSTLRRAAPFVVSIDPPTLQLSHCGPDEVAARTPSP